MPKKQEPEVEKEEEPEERPEGRPMPNKRLQATQAQVDEVVDVMKMNIEKVLERDGKLCQLDDRADKLQEDANQFKSQAAAMKNKFWLQNLKMMIIMGIIGAILLLVIYVKMGGDPKDLVPTMPEGEGDGGAEAEPGAEGAAADAGDQDSTNTDTGPAGAAGDATGGGASAKQPTRGNRR